AAHGQSCAVITTQVRHHDPRRAGQVDELLRNVMSELPEEVPASRRGEPVEPLRRLPVADIGHLRQRTSELRPPQPPAPLREWEETEDVTTADTRAWGGPRYAELEEHLVTFAGGEGSVDVVAAFRAADEDLRRPVDLLGLLEIAHDAGMTETDEVTPVDTVQLGRASCRES